jgi:hypothetical protein
MPEQSLPTRESLQSRGAAMISSVTLRHDDTIDQAAG